jgi:hypothetical protein
VRSANASSQGDLEGTRCPSGTLYRRNERTVVWPLLKWNSDPGLISHDALTNGSKIPFSAPVSKNSCRNCVQTPFTNNPAMDWMQTALGIQFAAGCSARFPPTK